MELSENRRPLVAVPRWGWRVDALSKTIRRIGKLVTNRRSPVEARAVVERLASLAPRSATVLRRSASFGGVPGTWYLPRRERREATILYVHGGGYSLGSNRTHDMLLTELARTSETRCLAIEYRLAPEHPFPAGIEDCVDAYRGLLAVGVDPRRIVLAGDSAGGGLVLAALQCLRAAGDPLPAGAVLMSPWVDLTLAGPTIDLHEEYCYLSRDVMERFAAAYLDGVDPSHPLASPLHASLEGLCPMLVQVGGAETLLWEARELARRAREHGVEIELQEWPGMFHAFQGFNLFLPDASRALGAVGDFLDDLFARPVSRHGWHQHALRAQVG